MDARDYRAMIEDSTVDTSIFEYRRQNGSLIAVALVDNLSDGLSAVYSFFDPSEQRRGLGTFIILDLIKESQTLGLPHVYLGYWIAFNLWKVFGAETGLAFRPVTVLTVNLWLAIPRRNY